MSLSEFSQEPKPTHGVGSARKALQMLLCFTPENPRRTPSELAGQLELSIATTYRHVSLFREMGLVEDAPDSRIQLTPRVLPIARAAMAVQDAVSVAAPYLYVLADEVEETVMLTRQAGSVAVVMFSLPSTHALRLDFSIGHTFTFGAGATTRMLLAMMAPPERDRYLKTIQDTARPEPSELDRIADKGWASSQEELEAGVWACAAGLSLDGQPPMTITVAGPQFRLNDQRRKRVIDKATRTAADIAKSWSADIGIQAALTMEG